CIQSETLTEVTEFTFELIPAHRKNPPVVRLRLPRTRARTAPCTRPSSHRHITAPLIAIGPLSGVALLDDDGPRVRHILRGLGSGDASIEQCNGGLYPVIAHRPVDRAFGILFQLPKCMFFKA